MKIEELETIVRQGIVIPFNIERRYIVVLDFHSVHGATTSKLAADLRKMGVRAAVLLADMQEGREPPLQVFEMRADVQ